MKKLLAVLMTVAMFAIPRPVEIPEGAYGVWQAPAINTATPVYFSDTRTGQEVVDAKNAALIRAYGDGYLIADHYGSPVDGGEWNVNEMRVGEPGFLIRADGTLCYECAAVCLCECDGSDYLFRGESIRPDDSDVICVGCAWGDYVFLAYYDYSGEIP